jgi:hypothetical protein
LNFIACFLRKQSKNAPYERTCHGQNAGAPLVLTSGTEPSTAGVCSFAVLNLDEEDRFPTPRRTLLQQNPHLRVLPGAEPASNFTGNL